MSFQCRVEADSLSPGGVRLTTFVITYPRCIHSELLTHRVLSRNSASSRAIPVEKMLARVEDDPFVPLYFGRNQKGMQDGGELADEEAREARGVWLKARDNALYSARQLAGLGVHKQLANRVLEPWMWITVVVSATDWANFFALRCHPAAEPHFQYIAGMMRDAMAASEPEPFEPGWWHMPFVFEEELSQICAGGGESRERYKLISAGRCARVSYLTHDNRRDPEADVELARRLMSTRPAHASPFEHVATPCPGRHANFRGWRQFRLEIAGHERPEEATNG